MRASLKWFEKKLPIPKKFSKNRNNYHKNNLSTTWVKGSAKEVISQLLHLKLMVEELGEAIDVLRTPNPGYIIYEDEYQVVVSPHSRSKIVIR